MSSDRANKSSQPQVEWAGNICKYPPCWSVAVRSGYHSMLLPHHEHRLKRKASAGSFPPPSRSDTPCSQTKSHLVSLPLPVGHSSFVTLPLTLSLSRSLSFNSLSYPLRSRSAEPPSARRRSLPSRDAASLARCPRSGLQPWTPYPSPSRSLAVARVIPVVDEARVGRLSCCTESLSPSHAAPRRRIACLRSLTSPGPHVDSLFLSRCPSSPDLPTLPIFQFFFPQNPPSCSAPHCRQENIPSPSAAARSSTPVDSLRQLGVRLGSLPLFKY